MRLNTLAAYLVGEKNAVLRVARDRSALMMGAVFVLSAAFAREYDAVDLRREPWRLALPFAASLCMSALLYPVVHVGLTPRSSRGMDNAFSYRAFLGCFWMTAPLAWLYAIPYERFLSEGAAARLNLATLGFVALWRVLLITRVSAILSGRRFAAAFFPIMLIADAAMLLALIFSPVPPLQVMGGVRLTVREEFIQATAFNFGLGAVVTFPIWLIGSVIVIRSTKKVWGTALASPPRPAAEGYAVWFLAACSILVWSFLLPTPQRQLRRANSVDDLLHSGKLKQAVSLMSSGPRSEFPPVWEPAPRMGYGERSPAPLDVLEVIAQSHAANWVTSEYLRKIDISLLSSPYFGDVVLTGREWSRFVQVIGEVPGGSDFLIEHAQAVREIREFDRKVLDETAPSSQPATAP